MDTGIESVHCISRHTKKNRYLNQYQKGQNSWQNLVVTNTTVFNQLVFVDALIFTLLPVQERYCFYRWIMQVKHIRKRVSIHNMFVCVHKQYTLVFLFRSYLGYDVYMEHKTSDDLYL